jgi:hypothetical protein
MTQENPERSETRIVCPNPLHDDGKELQEKKNSAKGMTALLSHNVQTYDGWTLIANRNGKGGTNQAFPGPKEPKVRPKDGKREQSTKTEVGSQLIK